jgi:hypothetical protein
MFVFRDFPPYIIRGFLQRRDIEGTRVFLACVGEQAVVECRDRTKANELFAIGIGGCVKLFNVKVSLKDGAILTASSGVRALPKEATQQITNYEMDQGHDDINTSIATTIQPQRWICLICNWLNYSCSSVCFSCKMTRKEGPVASPSFFEGLRGPPFTYETWTCIHCFARKNSHWKHDCWKCSRDRPKEKKRKIALSRSSKAIE